MRSMGESIGIGLAASATSKGPQVKTTEPIDSIKVTNYNIQLGWILARDGFTKKYLGSRPEAKKCHFSFSACGWIYGWMDVIVFFVHDFFYTVLPIKMKLKTYITLVIRESFSLVYNYTILLIMERNFFEGSF